MLPYNVGYSDQHGYFIYIDDLGYIRSLFIVTGLRLWYFGVFLIFCSVCSSSNYF